MHKRIKFWPSSEWLILVKGTALWATASEYAWSPLKTPHIDGKGFLWPLYRKLPHSGTAQRSLCFVCQSIIHLGGQGTTCSEPSGTLLTAESGGGKGKPHSKLLSFLGPRSAGRAAWVAGWTAAVNDDTAMVRAAASVYQALARVGRQTDCYLDSVLLSQHPAARLSFQKSKPGHPTPGASLCPGIKSKPLPHTLCSQHCCASAGNASPELAASLRGAVPEPVRETPPLSGPAVATPYCEIRRVGVHVCVCVEGTLHGSRVLSLFCPLLCPRTRTVPDSQDTSIHAVQLGSE